MFSKLTSLNFLGSCDFYVMIKIMFILFIQDHSLGIAILYFSPIEFLRIIVECQLWGRSYLGLQMLQPYVWYDSCSWRPFSLIDLDYYQENIVFKAWNIAVVWNNTVKFCELSGHIVSINLCWKQMAYSNWVIWKEFGKSTIY